MGGNFWMLIDTHTMRKSRGKAMFDAGVPIEKIAKVLNYSDTGVTLRYLGITQEAILKTYDEFELWLLKDLPNLDRRMLNPTKHSFAQVMPGQFFSDRRRNSSECTEKLELTGG